MKILAIDPATACGWAISNTIYGTWDLRVKRDESAGMKYIRLRSKLREIHKSENLELIVFETPAGQYKAPIMSHASLNSVIQVFCIDNNIEYRGYAPKEIKRHATGKGNCNKEAMIQAAKDKLGYEGDDDNIADALWILNLAQRDLE